jgi:hypothetical protein
MRTPRMRSVKLRAKKSGKGNARGNFRMTCEEE